MKQPRRVLSYANVAATLALFLALSGGVVYAAGGLGKNVVKTKNIAPKAVKTKNIAPKAIKTNTIAANAVTGGKIKKETITPGKIKKASLTRTNLAAGTLAGLQVAEVNVAAVPGLTAFTEGGTPVALTGTTSFTPVAGKSYELLTELKGTPTDADGAETEKTCSAGVNMFVNGAAVSGAYIYHNASSPPPFGYEPVGSSSVPVGMLSPGVPQTLSALAFGSTGCSAATVAALRATVVEFG